MSAPTARSVALELIGRVIDDGAYSNRLLPALLSRSGLDPRDRAFATELAFGTLRRRLVLDAAIERVANRPLDKVSPPEARNALRLGAYQLSVGVAPHAAVSATVDLVPGRPRGFVNAVLRRLATAPIARPDGTDAEAIAARTGMRPWAIEELERLVGEEAETAAAAFASRAPLSVRVVGGVDAAPTVRQALETAGATVTLGAVDDTCLLLEDGGEPRTLPGFSDGRWTVQDQASAFVVGALDPQLGDRVYDACAAPGGKALFAAERVGAEGAVLASDVSPRRVRLIAEAGARLKQKPWLLASDAARPAVSGSFERVLVDAPCSGLGSARRRPELLWRVPKERVTSLAARQLAIVSTAADSLVPGARLVYAVCTFTRGETDAVCDALLRARPELRPVVIDGPDGPAERHRLWPHRHGCDGMFVAAFERAS
ncbi:MAG TPA: transcription antitermination factor NusB [Actinomycetota bacterium]|jgi:16S rRNA (cytosine967-C5)-methyltransferase|nr:transcription antitermination factor NusB [Actinomycetota bacterium]